MKTFLKRSKKPLLTKIVSKLTGTHSYQDRTAFDFSFCDIRISNDEVAAIASMRNELRTIKHCNLEAIIICRQ